MTDGIDAIQQASPCRWIADIAPHVLSVARQPVGHAVVGGRVEIVDDHDIVLQLQQLVDDV